ncbi:hypothetical protein K488DRAFT_31255, partial [Vararia minispora EC-137]
TSYQPQANWADPPHPDASGQFIFNAVSSLLQLWPNTLWPAGHSIVPATIPRGTVLYHATPNVNGTLPTAPDWFAFDPEHAYVFCRQHCRVFALATTRPLKLIYFDGSSASTGPPGVSAMEVQDLLAWGRLRPDRQGDEFGRIKALCEWAKPRGLDGFIRMEFDFEVMYCDLSGLRLLSSSNLLPKTGYPPKDPPHGWRGLLPSFSSVFLQAIVAGSWHHRLPGEMRVKLDITGFVTFYDPALRSLTGARRGVERMRHQLVGISHADIESKLAELENVLKREPTVSSVDWQSIAQIIVQRYAPRLAQLGHTLDQKSGRSFANAKERVAAVRAELLVLLTPYLSPDNVPSSGTDAGAEWLAPVVNRCSFAHVGHLNYEDFTPQEHIIHSAFAETTHEICRTLGLIWADAFAVDSADEDVAARLLVIWKKQVTHLMHWLDWVEWRTCRPVCALDEFCYIATWPFIV